MQPQHSRRQQHPRRRRRRRTCSKALQQGHHTRRSAVSVVCMFPVGLWLAGRTMPLPHKSPLRAVCPLQQH